MSGATLRLQSPPRHSSMIFPFKASDSIVQRFPSGTPCLMVGHLYYIPYSSIFSHSNRSISPFCSKIFLWLSHCHGPMVFSWLPDVFPILGPGPVCWDAAPGCIRRHCVPGVLSNMRLTCSIDKTRHQKITKGLAWNSSIQQKSFYCHATSNIKYIDSLNLPGPPFAFPLDCLVPDLPSKPGMAVAGGNPCPRVYRGRHKTKSIDSRSIFQSHCTRGDVRDSPGSQKFE
jgi:hypothetical protein